jgi:hypothetical protein
MSIYVMFILRRALVPDFRFDCVPSRFLIVQMHKPRQVVEVLNITY